MNIFLKATTPEGKTELFNLDRVLTITPNNNGTVKILMGAGLYWTVNAESIQLAECVNELLFEIKGAKHNG